MKDKPNEDRQFDFLWNLKMSTPAEIADPDMRKAWKDVKKAAEKKATAKRQDSAYKALAKKFDLDLGPSLKKWPGSYPNLGEMRTKKGKIDQTIAKYERFVKDAKGSLDRTVWTLISSGLTAARDQLETRLAIAVSLLEQDEDLALSQAIKESKKKPLKPVVVFKHPDLSEEIMKMAPKARAFVEIEKLEVEVILSDDKILKQVDDQDGDMAQKIKDAAKFDQLKKDIAVAYLKAAKTVKADDSAFNRANTVFENDFETAVQSAVDRAGNEMYRLASVRSEYRNYRIKAGAKLTMTVVGTIAGGASLALAPFTGPAMVISALGVLRGAVAIGDQIADLSMSAEELIRELKADVKNLTSRYRDWKGSQIGGTEVGVTLVNAILPTFFTTIKRCASHCGTIGSKINGIETQAGNASIKLNQALDAQQTVQTQVGKWVKANKTHINGQLKTSVKKLLVALKTNEQKVDGLIEQIGNLNDRVRKARTDQQKLNRAIQALSAKEPTAAKFAEVFIEIGSSVGFLVSANVGWPDAYNIAESAKAVVDGIGNAVGSLDGAVAAAEEVKGQFDDIRG